MPLQNILDRKGSQVFTIAPDAAVADAVTLLAQHKIGAIVVSSNGKTIDGILSERDIVRSIADSPDTTMSMPVSKLMTENVQTCAMNTTISELMELMTKNRIRHLPVEVDGQLGGLVSIGDVVQARLNELEDERRHIEEYITS